MELRIPRDIALIGCGNHYDPSLRVPLSSIDQQSTALGECAAKILLAGFAAKTPAPPPVVVLDPGPVARALPLQRSVRFVLICCSKFTCRNVPGAT